jgi:hypothetical protein
MVYQAVAGTTRATSVLVDIEPILRGNLTRVTGGVFSNISRRFSRIGGVFRALRARIDADPLGWDDEFGSDLQRRWARRR